MSRAKALDLLDTTRPSPEMLTRFEAIQSNTDLPKRWIPSRLIVINYWFVDYQEFFFAGGRLVLNGRNGSGKSTVGAVAIPVALDMNKHRRRFDPFGGHERSPAYYLIGLPNATEQAAFYHEDRTGYIIWEFRHAETGRYATIGVGLRAKRSDGNDPPLEAWGFVADGRRIEPDDLVMTTTDGRKGEIPLTRQELQRLVGAPHVFRKNHDYQEAVNNLLFGFDNVDEYLTYTDTLFALRMPKLDRGVSPESLSKSLQQALPSLSQELVNRLSLLIQRIDSAMEALTNTARHVQLVGKIDDAQGDYANQMAQQAGVAVLERGRALTAAKQKHDATVAAIILAKKKYDEVSARFDTASRELVEKESAYDVKRASDAYKSVEHLEAAQRELSGAEKHQQNAQRELEAAEARVDAIVAQQEALAREYHGDVGEIEARAEGIVEAAKDARWPAVEQHVRKARAALTRITVDDIPPEDAHPAILLDTPVLAADADDRQRRCLAVEHAIEARAQAHAKFQEAQHLLGLAQARMATADETVRAKTDALDEARAAASDALAAWASEAPHTVVDATIHAGITAVSEYAGGIPHAVFAPFLTEARAADQTQQEREREIGRQIVSAEHDVERLTDELQAWKDKAWATPAARLGQDSARERIAAAGIAAVPLYAACDFAPGVDLAEQVRIEAALEEAGLLDALVVATSDRNKVDALMGHQGEKPAGDRWLTPRGENAPATGKTLADVLVPATNTMAATDVLSVLRAIALPAGAGGAGGDRAAASVAANGRWTHGLLHGLVAPRSIEEPAYIGESNRKRRRDQQIERLKRKIRETEDQVAALQQMEREVQKIREAIRVALNDLQELPALLTLQDAAAARATAQRELDAASQQVTIADREVTAKREVARAADSEYETAIGAFDALHGLSRGDVQDIRNRTRATMSELRDLEQAINRLDRLRTRAEALRTSARQERELVVERREGLQAAIGARHGVDARIQAIEEVLAGTDARALREEVEGLKRAITELRDETGELREERGKASTRVEGLEKQASEQATAIVRADGDARTAVQEFELRLGAYREAGLIRAMDKFQDPEQGPEAAARDLLRNRRSDEDALGSRVEDRLTRIISRLHTVFNAYKADLAEHRPEISGDNQASFVSQGDGQRVAPDVFLERLRAIEAAQRATVSDAENALYVDFFLSDVLSAVRRQVLEAKAFTAKVNDILKSMQFSNGAAFSFTWEPKAEHGQGGVNYSKLVEFVLLDPEAMSEEKRSTMLAEFRTRVDSVRTLAEGAGEGVYAERLAQEFDYRTWYQFRFFFRKPEGVVVELKQRGIEELSGGERTLAQILPLLAAVHARSLAARADAPKVIAMDEAFAGVDYQNTNEILRAMVELEFAWLMTSDKLWGDSRVVPACATYQLKAENGMMLPMLFLWDGRRRLSELEVIELAAKSGVALPTHVHSNGNGLDHSAAIPEQMALPPQGPGNLPTATS